MPGPRYPALSFLFLLLALAAASFVPRGLIAQEIVEVQVVAAGMSVAGVEIYVLALGEPFLVGETDAEGMVAAPADLVGLSAGDRLDVRQVVCAERRAVLLVPRDQDAGQECDRRKAEDPTCDCGSLPRTSWDERVVVDLVSEAPPEPRAEPGRTIRWTVGGGAGWSSWPNLENACSAEPLARTCSLDAEGPTFRAAVQAERAGVPLSLMAALGYTPGLGLDQAFDPTTNPLNPVRNVVDLDILTFEGYAVGSFSASETVDAFVAAGYVWAHDRIEATTTYGVEGASGTDSRTSSGGRFGARAGFDWWPADRVWGVRVEAGGMTGKDDNIDAGWSVGAMFLYPIGVGSW